MSGIDAGLEIYEGQIGQNGPRKIWGRQPLRDLKGYVLLRLTILFKFFKGCLPQILFDLFLNTLSHLALKG